MVPVGSPRCTGSWPRSDANGDGWWSSASSWPSWPCPPRSTRSRPSDRPWAVDELVTRIKASAGQPYHGYAEGHGGLRLPELPGAADLSTLTSDTSRIRVWYESPDRWRTDLLYSGGERDRYGTRGGDVDVGFGHAPRRLPGGRDPAPPAHPGRPHPA